jgi:hypothetical protein
LLSDAQRKKFTAMRGLFMTELTCTIKVVFSKALIREITMMYVRRKFAGKAFRFILVFVIYLCGCVYGLILPHTPTGVVWAVVSGGCALAVALLAGRSYNLVHKRLEKAYRVDSKAGIEYSLTMDKIIISLDQKQSELIWTSIQDVWVSKNVLMLLNSDKYHVPLPICELSLDQRSFVMERIEGIYLFSRREKRLLSERKKVTH